VSGQRGSLSGRFKSHFPMLLLKQPVLKTLPKWVCQMCSFFHFLFIREWRIIKFFMTYKVHSSLNVVPFSLSN